MKLKPWIEKHEFVIRVVATILAMVAGLTGLIIMDSL